MDASIARVRRVRLLLLVAAALAGCRKPAPAAPSGVEGSYPRTLDRAAYAGSDKCASCHAAEHQAWLASPHGRSVLPPSPATVLGDFKAPPLAIDGGAVAFSRDGDRYSMEIRREHRSTQHAVDLVLGSGRQHQDYFTRETDPQTGDARFYMLPAIWATPKGPWLDSSFYQGGSASTKSPDYWRKRTLVELGCANCHVSQGGYVLGSGAPRVVWGETRINCESCHGPGAAHVARRSGQAAAGPEVRDLGNLGPAEEAQTCGTCHALREGHRAGTDAAGLPWFAPATLRDGMLRVDGTQTLTTYQYSGHVLSECYRGGGLRCVSCHSPHSGAPRAVDGESAAGAASNRQCTACHRNYLDGKAEHAHGHHQKTLRCIDCHMAPSFIGDNDRNHQKTADHTISIPRPQEAIEFGTPNACTTCHAQKSPAWALEALRKWGDSKALGVRPWVRAVALGRKRAPEASPLLTAILAQPGSGNYLAASALDLLEALPADAGSVAAIEPFTRNADPWLRALAYRALIRHDPGHARDHWNRGMADSSGLVRVWVLPFAQPGSLTPALLEQFLRDELDWSQRPEAGHLIQLSRAFSSIGESRRALEVLELARRAATPAEQAETHLPELIAHAQRDLGAAPP